MSEEFNLDEAFNSLNLTLDEAAEARIAHAEYLNSMKDWSLEMGQIMQPFVKVATILENDRDNTELMERVSIMFPIGLKLAIKHFNKLYDVMQEEAVKVLGAPFALHDSHSSECDGTRNNCGHQSHWKDN